MEPGIHLSSKRKLRNSKTKTAEEKDLSIMDGIYYGKHYIVLKFSNGIQKSLDFYPILNEFAKGTYARFIEIKNFKRFKIANGNISWGKNEDIIFPVSYLYNHPKAKKEKEEILYVI